ncbi:conserved hypothetical protein [gamma proteobacterium HdN1]|nr:conserved hypothetical protein [gamma proteobacterium HdN1]
MRSLLVSSLIFAPLVNVLAANAQAHEFSTTVGVVSDYLSNGISQSKKHPTLQASLDYEHERFSAEIWTSDVDFEVDDNGREADSEVDYYIGYNLPLSDNFSLDFTAAWYQYPGVDSSVQADYGDISVGLTAWENSEIKVSYSDNYWGGSGKSWTYHVAQQWPLSDSLALNAQVNMLHNQTSDYWYGDKQYVHYQIGVQKTLREFDLELAWSDTDVQSKDDPEKTAKGVFWVSVSRTFSL